MLSDGYVKYEEAEVHRSAIMLDFRDNKYNKLKWQIGGHFRFYNCKICLGYPCAKHYILFYLHGPAILLFFLVKYHKINQIQNGH